MIRRRSTSHSTTRRSAASRRVPCSRWRRLATTPSSRATRATRTAISSCRAGRGPGRRRQVGRDQEHRRVVHRQLESRPGAEGDRDVPRGQRQHRRRRALAERRDGRRRDRRARRPPARRQGGRLRTGRRRDGAARCRARAADGRRLEGCAGAGQAAGNAAVQLCGGATVETISGTAPFTTPTGKTVPSILIEPVAVTRDNLDQVVTSGWITRDTLCAGVNPGSVAACS